MRGWAHALRLGAPPIRNVAHRVAAAGGTGDGDRPAADGLRWRSARNVHLDFLTPAGPARYRDGDFERAKVHGRMNSVGLRPSGLILMAACLLSGAGCLLNEPRAVDENEILPVVTVSSFENRSGFAGQWQLGTGMADLLVSELVGGERAARSKQAPVIRLPRGVGARSGGDSSPTASFSR